MIVIEHNLDVVKTADWVIDMGPEGGSGGGMVVATGTPEDIAATEGSHTGRFLAPLIGGSGHSAQAKNRTATKQVTKRAKPPLEAER